ncbi:unnamed protein product [Eruca vesicaria subsp. sativa]|uniref:Uncharacterized protein n=1 Tax=Eruca vesicaria subsp. sativa TaxID=29727 RepID=A0ABC8KKZ0_ERUVS|nr:unnamed protein product [Eruca vesicaria subsp. sativa]
MDLSDLEYSDAGESGWTMYLDHSSSVSFHHFDDANGETNQEHDQDSSMVSDASSGPPYYSKKAVPEDPLQQNTQYWCKSTIKNKKKAHEEQGYIERFNSCLDDTASSLAKYELGFLQQASPVEKFASDHQGYDGSNQIKRRG